MDKYEFNAKVEQIERLARSRDYYTASRIADGIDWTRIRNSNILTMIADIYEKTGNLDAAKEIKLYTAQEREWLDKCLELFDIKAKVKEVKDAISYTSYVITTDKLTEDIIKRLMRFNYEKNFS